ncbi:rhamnulokinase [Actinotalea sp. M2MS4P-6]|uniref:rhamnulokinase n=1 Tax=Actinotalea sp. M2MS4P-6 TaxID=2983762 RepID=UPI0021E373A5|nr:rhamnulokinase family protein [Actinotalea sp. M2MS4P-6]MCV2395883.1 rhamnulokinase [Actinotalea sp. M2MS4P-6]
MAGTYLAVDLGASSGRVIAGHLDGGRLVTVETGRFSNVPVWFPEGGRRTLRWDVAALWGGIQQGLRAAAREHGAPVSVGVDSWGVDHGLLDADDALLGNPVHYRDARTEGAVERFFEVLAAEEHYAATGLQVLPINTVFQLVAGAGSAQQQAARRLLLMPDLVSHWLSGAAVTEVTNASTTGMLDPTTRTWSAPVLDALAAVTGADVRPLLAPLVEPGQTIGAVRTDVAADLGLAGARVVAVGSHDTASAVVSVPMADAARAAYISSGTWSLVGLELDAPVLSEASRAANVTNELGVASTVRYLRNVGGLWLLQESLRTWADQGRPQDLAGLLAAAADVPALRTVVDVDDPVFAPPGDMPARVADAARESGQPVPEDPAAVTRCLLDSLALAYRRAIEQVTSLSGRTVEVVHVVGGGSRNALLCRLTADATGLPVVAGPAEGTAIGNLLVQAWAAGEVSGGLPELRAIVAASEEPVRYEPSGDEQAWVRAAERLR